MDIFNQANVQKRTLSSLCTRKSRSFLYLHERSWVRRDGQRFVFVLSTYVIPLYPKDLLSSYMPKPTKYHFQTIFLSESYGLNAFMAMSLFYLLPIVLHLFLLLIRLTRVRAFQLPSFYQYILHEIVLKKGN